MPKHMYGMKGGRGPTAGLRAGVFVVTLPDGTTARKRNFRDTLDPVGYAYNHDGKWYVAAVGEPDAVCLQHYTKCPAVRVS